jgi:hypothetical protein
MITFRPYSVPAIPPRFGRQSGVAEPIHVFIPTYDLKASQKKVLADMQRTGIITEVKSLQEYPQLVRVTLRPDQDPAKFSETVGGEYIGAIIKGEPAFSHFEHLEATRDYAFAT